jgi:hypothetical protein
MPSLAPSRNRTPSRTDRDRPVGLLLSKVAHSGGGTSGLYLGDVWIESRLELVCKQIVRGFTQSLLMNAGIAGRRQTMLRPDPYQFIIQ